MEDTGRMVVSRRRLLQNGMLMASGFALAPPVFSAAMGAQDKPDNLAGGESWTIGNELIARTVAFGPKTGLFTQRMSDLATHTDFITPGETRSFRTPEFSFRCGARSCAGESPQWDLLGASQDALSHGKSLTIRLRHTEVPVEVSVVYSVYDGHAAIRKHLVLHNTGTSALRMVSGPTPAIPPVNNKMQSYSLPLPFGAAAGRFDSGKSPRSLPPSYAR